MKSSAFVVAALVTRSLAHGGVTYVLMVHTTRVWGPADVLKALVVTSTIPPALADGQYPPILPECAQLIVTDTTETAS
ncbi:hypothetical protein BDN72DRAFT_894627 [Pluteus cervinus]|uniref:Uncharacterized protein n=1 Tax=Pluteus cervinus TaxID=181527 RepID=A0ACD3B437_9AGAR|nr:hypothetical protein BDN72DRAFT_894627 [Pluteus cervinus]